MVKPSPQLQARMRFTTKQVAGGFYRGTRTGAMGSHTSYGGYIIDYRKTRHYVVPDFKDFKVRLPSDSVCHRGQLLMSRVLLAHAICQSGDQRSWSSKRRQ